MFYKLYRLIKINYNTPNDKKFSVIGVKDVYAILTDKEYSRLKTSIFLISSGIDKSANYTIFVDYDKSVLKMLYRKSRNGVKITSNYIADIISSRKNIMSTMKSFSLYSSPLMSKYMSTIDINISTINVLDYMEGLILSGYNSCNIRINSEKSEKDIDQIMSIYKNFLINKICDLHEESLMSGLASIRKEIEKKLSELAELEMEYKKSIKLINVNRCGECVYFNFKDNRRKGEKKWKVLKLYRRLLTFIGLLTREMVRLKF